MSKHFLILAACASVLALPLSGCGHSDGAVAAAGGGPPKFPGARPTPEQMQKYMSVPPPAKAASPTPSQTRP